MYTKVNRVQRDLIEFQLENQVVTEIRAERTGNAITLTAYSKTGDILGTPQTFGLTDERGGITELVLDEEAHNLHLKFNIGEDLICPLDLLYDKVKQEVIEVVTPTVEEVKATTEELKEWVENKEYVQDINIKLNDYYDKETTDQLLDDLETKADDVSILYNDEGELTLNPVFLEYLQNATYKKPSIVAFTVSGLKSSYIVGETISSSSFAHYESEIENLKGNLTLSITGGYSETIKPTSSNTTITLATPYSKKFTSHGEEVIFTLKGTDVKGNSISKSTSKKAYYPFYHGVSSSTEITETLAKGLTTKIGLTSGSYTYNLSENAYIYWITTAAISSIKDPNGNVIDYVRLDDLTMPVVTGGANVTYKVYRTLDKLVEGSWVFTVA